MKKFKKGICNTFLVNILAVDYGIKAAWLCDICKTSLNEMKETLFTLKEKGIITKNLSVLSLGLDILVVDIETLKKHIDRIALYLKSDNSTSGIYRFVYLKKFGQMAANIPTKIVDLLLTNLELIQKQLVDLTNPSFIDLKLINEFLTPTIFGIALEYPVIYVTECESDFQIESLDLAVIKLDIWSRDKFNCLLKGDGGDTVRISYSFSVPLEVESFFESSITSWHTEILLRCIKVDFNCEYSKVERNCFVTL